MVLVLLVLVLLLPLLVRRDQITDGLDRQQINVAIARTQLEDLRQRLHDGELSNSEFELERQRLERDLAGDIERGPEAKQQGGGQWMLWPVAVLVPVLAGFLYLQIGTPEAINLPATQTARQAETARSQQQAISDQSPDMNAVVAQIKQRLSEEPEDARGWFMLGRAHMTLGEFDDAVVAIRRSLQLNGDEPEILIRLADAIAMSQQGSMAGEPEPLIERALAIDPQNMQGLWLLGMAQADRGDNTAAIATWNTLLPLLSGDARSEAEVRQLIAQAQQQLSNIATVPAATTSVNSKEVANTQASDQQNSDAAGQVVVSVQLADGVAQGLPADTSVFVYAKATNGPPMPLAVSRRTIDDIPFTVTLSDADAMIPAMRLSQFKEINVGARISLSGDAIARNGDFYGELSLDTGSVTDVTIEIGKQVQ